MSDIAFYCRVCGFGLEYSPWGEDGASPTYEFCPCCGCEFGNHDYTIESVRRFRKHWLDNGAKWFYAPEKPTSWDLEKQLLNVEENYI